LVPGFHRLSFSGGCKYDMGAGFCLENSVDSASFGCASLVEDYAVSKISPHVSVLIGTQVGRKIDIRNLNYILQLNYVNYLYFDIFF
jgi:hypothetical protein